MAVEKTKFANPLLSEFDKFPIWNKYISRQYLIRVAIAWFLISIIPIIFGILANTNCMEVSISSEYNKNIVIRAYFGYIYELNHGLFYTIVMSILIAVVISSIEKAGNNIIGLANDGRISVNGDLANDSTHPDAKEKSSTIATISRYNRKIFSIAVILIPMSAFAIIGATELPVVQQKSFGWVQALSVVENDDKLLRDWETNELPEVTVRWQAEYANRWNPSTNVSIYQQIVNDPQLGLSVRVVRPKPDGQTRSSMKNWFYPFLAAALIVESLTITIALYVVAKILFLAWILLSAQWFDGPDGDRVAPHAKILSLVGVKPRFRFSLNFEDADDKRFGISRVDTFYNFGLLFAVFASIVFFVGRLSNLSKGSAWTIEQGGTNVGPLLIPFFVLIAIGLLCAYPFFHLVNKVEVHKDNILRHLLEKSKRSLIEQQTIWPGMKSRPVILLSVCFVFVVLFPLGLGSFASLFGVPVGAQAVTEYARTISNIVCR